MTAIVWTSSLLDRTPVHVFTHRAAPRDLHKSWGAARGWAEGMMGEPTACGQDVAIVWRDSPEGRIGQHMRGTFLRSTQAERLELPFCRRCFPDRWVTLPLWKEPRP